MNKLALIVILSFSVLTTYAQTNSDSLRHLTFKGVPIDGTLSEYVSKMKKSGFIHKSTKDGIAILEGDFASYKNCIVGVSTLKQKDLVSKIVVMFPDRDNWPSLSSNYFNLKDLLTEKYGAPYETVEEFQMVNSDNDGTKFTQVQLGSCKYYTTYKTSNGTIQLSIAHEELTRCFITLVYMDKINSETIKKQALDDL